MMKIRSFIEDTMEEVKKCSWPTKDQLFESTLLVLIVLVVLTVFVAAVDQILFFFVRPAFEVTGLALPMLLNF